MTNDTSCLSRPLHLKNSFPPSVRVSSGVINVCFGLLQAAPLTALDPNHHQLKKPIEQLGIVSETGTPNITGKDTRITGLVYISHKLPHATLSKPTLPALHTHFLLASKNPLLLTQLYHWPHLPGTNPKPDQSWINLNQD